MDRRKTLAALTGALAGYASTRLADLALVGGSLATAVGAVGFAGYMTLAGNHETHVNGMEYLAIFAQPSHPAHHEDAERPSLDMAPTGALPRAEPPAREIKEQAGGYALVGAQSSFAWLREGNRIFAVRPGEDVPRLGRVAAIRQVEGRWTLLDDKGDTLLAGGVIELAAPSPERRFDKRMIFGGGR